MAQPFGVMSESSAREIDYWLGDERDRGLLVVAAALGLPRHHWFSFDYASRAPVTSPSERIEVAKDGTIVKDEDENADQGAPSADATGPLFRVAERLIRDLRDRDLLVLTVDADAARPRRRGSRARATPRSATPSLASYP